MSADTIPLPSEEIQFSAITPPPFLRRDEVKIYFPFLDEKVLGYLATQERGPRYAHIGRYCIYETAEVIRWIREQMKAPGSGRPVPPARKEGGTEGKLRVGRPTRAQARRKKRQEAQPVDR